MITNKLTRKLEAEKVLRRRKVAIGWRPLEELPLDTKKSIMAGGYRRDDRGGRKSFGKSKRGYGHHAGNCQSHLSRRDARERAEIRSHGFAA